MDETQVKLVIEAALLAAGRPLPMDTLASLFANKASELDKDTLKRALDALSEDYRDRGLELKEVASGYRIQVKSSMSDWLMPLWEERQPRYTRALLETLALIAYRQPITRGEIEDVRGVAVSTNIIRTLMERNWVRVVGHRDVPGKPAMFGTTKEFLDYFGLRKLEDLPPLAEIKDGFPETSPQTDFLDAEAAPDPDGGGTSDGLAANDSAAEGSGADSSAADSSGTESSTTEGASSVNVPEEGASGEGVEGEESEGAESEAEGAEPDATAAEGSAAEGSEPEGSEVEGSEAEGSEREGSDEEGFEAEGSEREDSEEEAFEAAGSEPEDSDDEGFEADGSKLEGFEAAGSEPEGPTSQDSADERSDTEGSIAEGSVVAGFALASDDADDASTFVAVAAVPGDMHELTGHEGFADLQDSEPQERSNQPGVVSEDSDEEEAPKEIVATVAETSRGAEENLVEAETESAVGVEADQEITAGAIAAESAADDVTGSESMATDDVEPGGRGDADVLPEAAEAGDTDAESAESAVAVADEAEPQEEAEPEDDAENRAKTG